MRKPVCRAKNPTTCRIHGADFDEQRVRDSKRLSYVLRHNPASVDITLSADGWVPLAVLARATGLSQSRIKQVAALDDKQRFTVHDGRIRAAQGHSVPVALGQPAMSPPDALYHGTVQKYLAMIFAQGLLKQKRQAVHLSADVTTASQVGARRGEPVVLLVDSKRMLLDGFAFQQADNGVWLTEHVPSRYLTLMP